MNENSSKSKITDPSRILTLANFISLLRALLAIPIIYTLKDDQYLNLTFWLIVIAILSDATLLPIESIAKLPIAIFL